MKVIKKGLDLSQRVVEFDCGVCGTVWQENAIDLTRTAALYHTGEGLSANARCPQCGATTLSHDVALFEREGA
jgi:predicted RNA-binding Zn-ribbon protein involved in translation (DUF1610 family)